LTFITENIYCCRSGSAADTQAIADMLKYYSEVYEQESATSTSVKVKLVANLFSSICYQNKDKLQAGIIVAGYDYHSQSGEVYSVPLGGSLHRQPFAIGGSGSTFIYGYCDAAYKEGMTREETVNFVKQCNPLSYL
jgi:20S proteasome subunit beta 1